MKNFKEKELKDLANIVGGEESQPIQITIKTQKDEWNCTVVILDINWVPK